MIQMHHQLTLIRRKAKMKAMQKRYQSMSPESPSSNHRQTFHPCPRKPKRRLSTLLQSSRKYLDQMKALPKRIAKRTVKKMKSPRITALPRVHQSHHFEKLRVHTMNGSSRIWKFPKKLRNCSNI